MLFLFGNRKLIDRGEIILGSRLTVDLDAVKRETPPARRCIVRHTDVALGVFRQLGKLIEISDELRVRRRCIHKLCDHFVCLRIDKFKVNVLISATAAQEEATAEVSAEAPAPEAPAREKTESAAPAQPASSTSVLAVGVTADSVRLRAAANTGSAILAELNRGTAVSILGRQDGWYKVNYDGKTGYMSADYVTARSSAGDLRCVARVISDGLNLRSGASASGAVLATVSRGEYVDVSGFENGWFRVQYSGKTGYMSGDHLTLAAARPAAPAPAPAAPASGTGAEIAALARSFVGKAPYVYGGAGPSGFDCSGFTMYIYGQFGIRLPHGATDQMRYGAAVDRSQLQPGDLIFFHDDYYSSSTASHCGIYVGNDQFVHASTYGSGGVLLTALNGNPYYSAHYIAARRMG